MQVHVNVLYIYVCIGNGDQIIVTFINHNGELGGGTVGMLPDKSSVLSNGHVHQLLSSKSFFFSAM